MSGLGASRSCLHPTDTHLSWREISQVYFKASNMTGGGISQPDLYELPQQLGSFPAGTVFVSGMATPSNRSSTNIEVHASYDKG